MRVAILKPCDGQRCREQRLRFRCIRALLTGAALLGSLTLLYPQMLSGQSATPQKSAAAQTTTDSGQGAAAKTAHPVHKRTAAHHKATPAKPAQQATVVVAPPAPPPPPDWPANHPANPATVTWDSKGLQIEASNSSLGQILHEVATNIGAKLQGISEDQRVFGTYGPGPAREVISRLLDGTGYNVVMIGGQGDAPPRQIILSKSLKGAPGPMNAAQTPQNNNDEDEQPYAQLPDVQEQQNEQQQQQNPPVRNPFANGGPARTPEQVQQEILRQQQQLQQQPDQSQQNNPQ